MAQNRNYKGKKPYNKGGSSGNRSGGNKNYQGNRDYRDNRNQSRNQRPPQKEGQQQDRQEQKTAATPKAAPDSGNDLLWFALVLLLVAGGFLFNKFYLAPRRPGIYNSNYKSPPLRKEGKLTFLEAQANEKIIDIDIQIADTPNEKNVGLANRTFLPANGGFLYAYQEEQLRTLTMERTYLSLDILFIDARREVVRITKKTQPLSPASIPSGGKVRYVLLVQAGFCDAFNIRIGDHVDF